MGVCVCGESNLTYDVEELAQYLSKSLAMEVDKYTFLTSLCSSGSTTVVR